MSTATRGHDRTQDPISRIKWLEAAELAVNDYNPNMVMDPELKLLERSILLTGWVQPVLARLPSSGERTAGDRPVIIDGFHRVQLSLSSAALRAKYNGLVPTSVIAITRAEAMLLTVRINAAKGSHRAIRMAELVRELIDQHGYDVETIARDAGLLPAEVERLHQDDVWKARGLASYRYSWAWTPAEETPAQVAHRKATGEHAPDYIRATAEAATDAPEVSARPNPPSRLKPRGGAPKK